MVILHDQSKDTGNEGELAGVLDKLLSYRQQNGEKNTLIMLALLSLLEIVSGMNKGEEKENSPAGNMPFNPAVLLNLLGGGPGKGKGFDLSSLMGLLGNFMGGAPAGSNMDAQSAPVGKAAGKMKVEKNVYQAEPKTEQRPGSVSGAKLEAKPEAKAVVRPVNAAAPQRHKKPGPVKWDFGPGARE